MASFDGKAFSCVNRYRGLLLDFYGTLVHEDDEIIPVICDEIRRHAATAVPVTAQETARVWWEDFSARCAGAHGDGFYSQRDLAQESLRAILDHFGADIDVPALIAHQFAHWGAPPLFPDSLPFLHTMTQAQIPVCIVSNIDRCDLEAAIALHGLDVARVITSDDVRAYKPRPDMFEAALAKLGLEAHEVLHVGDSRTSDVAGAQGVGIDVAWINRSGKPATGIITPTYTVRDLVELQTILLTHGAPS